MRTDATLAIAALVGIGLLHALAAWTEPDVVPIAAIREGARVAVEGRLLAVRGTFVTLHDGAHRIDGFAPRGAALGPGDVVRAVGVVSRGDTALLLSLERVDVLERAPGAPLSPAQLGRDPGAYDGARVAVAGVWRAGALADEGARVRVAGDPPPEREGWWIATGLFRYDADDAAYALRVESWTRSS